MTQIDNGRRLLVFERHCWALADLNDKAKLAFFNALLEYGTTGRTDFGDASGIVKTLLPEIIAISSASERNAERQRRKRERMRDGRRTDGERNANETRTNGERSGGKEEEEEEYITPIPPKGGRRTPSLDEVLSASALFGMPSGCTEDEYRDLVAAVYRDMVAAGWMDSTGKRIGNWRTYLKKAVFEKKILSARAGAAVTCYEREPL